MYCKNCGQQIDDNAVVCTQCGTNVDGRPQVTVEANVVRVTGQKNKLVAGILGLFLGGFGVHNFYLGFYGKGIVQILLCWTGISAIWALIEAILILTGHINQDAKGNYLIE
ncbi:MAG: TM2 domain-containing protein [Clostridia bacterium]